MPLLVGEHRKPSAAEAADQGQAGQDNTHLKSLGFAEGEASLQPSQAPQPVAGGQQMPPLPAPPAPVEAMPPLPDLPGLKLPGGGMPQLPHTPDPKAPAGGMPQLPQTPAAKAPAGGMPQLPHTPDPKAPAAGMPKLPHTPDPKAPAAGMPKAPLTPPEKKKAEDDKKKKTEAKAKAKVLSKWAVPGLDDPEAAFYCAKTKQASPDDLGTYTTLASGMVSVLKVKPAYERYRHLSDKDIANVVLYTTNAAYPMNAVLRGQLRSPEWIKAYGDVTKAVTKSLAKMPKGVANHQGSKDGKAHVLDATKAEDKIVPIGNVYRNDGWSGFFDPVFAGEFKVGRALEEPGFFSATVVEGSYMPKAPVRRTIEGAKVSRSLDDVSAVASEREALFPPGQRFQITKIELEDTKSGKRMSIGDPQMVFPKADGGEQAFNRAGRIWHIKLKHVGVAKGKKKGPAADKSKKDAGAQDAAKNKPGLLEKLLGMG